MRYLSIIKADDHVELPLFDDEADTFKGEGSIYGCGAMKHDNLDLLIDAVAHDKLLGIVGLTIPEQAVTDLEADLRGAVGTLYALGAPRIFVDDQLSVEWAAHYGLRAELGTSPLWLGDPNVDARAICLEPAHAIECALADVPMKLVVRAAPGRQNAMVQGRPNHNHPLVRWAERYGMSAALCTEPNADDFEGVLMPAEAVERAKQEARETLSMLFCKPPQETNDDIDVDRQVDEALKIVVPRQETAASRKLVVGEVFDPSTHYTKEYYDGSGIEYTQPDGSLAIYRGTALHWDGFEFVVRTLQRLLGPRIDGRILDVGSAAGNFVSRCIDRGWDCYGIDLSSEAHEHARPDIRPRLLVGDVTAPNASLQRRAPFKLITTWDLLEHIYEEQVREFVQALFDLLEPGGILWNCICTRGDGEQDITVQPGDKVTRELSWLMVSGHVTIRPWEWWARVCLDAGFVIRHNLANLFQVARSSDPAFSKTDSWKARNTLVVQKPMGDMR